MKIAVVGSGIAGLSAAWLLGRQHEVTLFERESRPGMGAHNLAYRHADVEVTIDVPLRAFNTCYYHNLVALYRELGVEMLHADHSCSYHSARTGDCYFSYRHLSIGKRAIPMLSRLSQLGLRSFLIVKDMAVFLLTAPRDRASGKVKGLSIHEYLVQCGYSTPFIDGVVLPTFAAICTCSDEAIRRYPAEVIIDFLAGGLLFNGIWRARHGADDAIRRMLASCATLHCEAAVKSIVTRSNEVLITEETGREHRFDHVVIAAQANQAARMLAAEESQAQQLLSQIAYERSEVVVHGDTAIIANHKQDKAPVHFWVDAAQDKPMASILLNRIYPALKQSPPLYQTWNPVLEPDAKLVLGRFHFERPVVTIESLAVLESLQQLQREPGRRIWFCGSYAMPGIPLQESAVQSAMFIADQLGVAIPWRQSAQGTVSSGSDYNLETLSAPTDLASLATR